jgi:hypothetical protein
MTTAMKLLALALSAFAVTSCAAQTARRTVVPPALPTSEELAAYVAAHWDGWGPRFAKFSDRQGETATLVKVENLKCGYRYVTPECDFDVTGDFGPGDGATRTMSSQFDRDAAGQLVEVFVLYDVKKR